MIKVQFLGPINKDDVCIQAHNLKELKEILKQDKDLEEWLGICAVALNDELVFDENQSFKEGDKIVLLPPVCGG